MPFDDLCAIFEVQDGQEKYYELHLYRTGERPEGAELEEIVAEISAQHEQAGLQSRPVAKFEGEVIDDVVTPELAVYWAKHGGNITDIAYYSESMEYISQEELDLEIAQFPGARITLLYNLPEQAQHMHSLSLPQDVTIGKSTEEAEIAIIRYGKLGVKNIIRDLFAAAKIYSGTAEVMDRTFFPNK